MQKRRPTGVLLCMEEPNGLDATIYLTKPLSEHNPLYFQFCADKQNQLKTKIFHTLYISARPVRAN